MSQTRTSEIPCATSSSEQKNLTMDGLFRLDEMCIDTSSYGAAQAIYVRRHKRLVEENVPSPPSYEQVKISPGQIDGALDVSEEIPLDTQVRGSETRAHSLCVDERGMRPVEIDLCVQNMQDSGEDSFKLTETPDRFPSNCLDLGKELADNEATIPETGSSMLKAESPELGFTLHKAQIAESTLKKQKQALRWSRELMSLIGDGEPTKTESTGVENGDICDRTLLPARKRRRLELANAVKREHSGFQKLHAFSKEAQQKWRDIQVDSCDPFQLIDCKCKVFWPDENTWYIGRISSYDAVSGTHHVAYEDGDNEDLILSKELFKVHISETEMKLRKIPSGSCVEDRKRFEYQEMAALASMSEDFQEEIRHGELVWAKIKGHPMWPAFVVDEKHTEIEVDAHVRETTVAVQFFGTYDFARISSKNVLSFSKGLNLKLYGKCKKPVFAQGIEEAERYLKEGKLPVTMFNLQNDAPDLVLNPSQTVTSDEDQDVMDDERTPQTKKSVECLHNFPIDLGDLQVLSLGKIVRDSEFFHTETHIWTEGYSAVRKFPSIKDPDRFVDYRMEIIKDPEDRTKPLFHVLPSDGDTVTGSTPAVCWKKVYQKLEKSKERLKALGMQSDKKRTPTVSGDSMFGFTNPQILKLIQALPFARACFKFTGWIDKKSIENMEPSIPAGFKPVEIDWKHADRCSVCDLDEEYTNNLFLQCDRCRILVHMHCYGSSDLPNGHLWLCQLCRSGLSQTSLCCLCPVQGGAMKRTTNKRWAHVTCAMWIPETCFVDVKNMEPIDGLHAINKERWKLTCSICKVPYGVCIQCSEPSCYSSYHVLCARSSGFVLEVVEDSSSKWRNEAEDGDEPIRFLSYCKRHRQLKLEKGLLVQQSNASNQEHSHSPPKSVSGCARTEPYNGALRRGRQEPEVKAAAAAKRNYVEKMPYLVRGFCRKENCESDFSPKLWALSLKAKVSQASKPLTSSMNAKPSVSKELETEPCGPRIGEILNVHSVAERFQHMRLSLKHRLTFGKSAIHGWGLFTKMTHRAGDMVIEYAGEVVRPIVADLRERLIYNNLVGAGTYMFQIDDERVVDATQEGSIAHLINHSCEPNCFSRVVTVNGDEHIIIFAKKNIDEGEELSYDYRFNSKGEQLECFCGFPSCRGFVNVNEVEEETNRILVPRSEITAWNPVLP